MRFVLLIGTFLAAGWSCKPAEPPLVSPISRFTIDGDTLPTQDPARSATSRGPSPGKAPDPWCFHIYEKNDANSYCQPSLSLCDSWRNEIREDYLERHGNPVNERLVTECGRKAQAYFCSRPITLTLRDGGVRHPVYCSLSSEQCAQRVQDLIVCNTDRVAHHCKNIDLVHVEPQEPCERMCGESMVTCATHGR